MPPIQISLVCPWRASLTRWECRVGSKARFATRLMVLAMAGIATTTAAGCGRPDASTGEQVRSVGGDVRENEQGRVDFVFFEGQSTTDDSLRSLADDLPRLKSLKRIQLLGTSVSGPGLDVFRGLSQVQAVDLSNSPVTDAGLDAVASLPELVTLNLSGTQVTDAGMAKLATLKHLRILDLSNTQVSDTGVKSLASISTVKSLRLKGAKVTARGLQQLKSALPGLSIVSD